MFTLGVEHETEENENPFLCNKTAILNFDDS